MRGNREFISEALANLIDNAINNMRAGILTRSTARPRRLSRVKAGADADRITLTVADHGPGIAVADRGRVVERFVRLEQSRSQPGSGLGLTFAAAVARLHGGELRLESNEPGLKSTIGFAAGRTRGRLMRAAKSGKRPVSKVEDGALVRRLTGALPRAAAKGRIAAPSGYRA